MEAHNEKYFEEKFKRVFDKLETIHNETKRTNSRVNRLEDKADQLKEHDLTYKCVKEETINEIEKSLVGWNMMKRVVYSVSGLFLLQIIYTFLSSIGLM